MAENSEQRFFIISEDMLERLISNAARVGGEAGAISARKEYCAMKEKQAATWSKRKLRNTRLLLSKYRTFKAAAESAIYNAETLEKNELKTSDILDLMMNTNHTDTMVESIQKSTIRTSLILAHVDRALIAYEAVCLREREETQRDFYMMRDYYISDIKASIEDLMKRECLHERAVYRSIEKASNRFADYVFGVDATKFH